MQFHGVVMKDNLTRLSNDWNTKTIDNFQARDK